ncbi:hypothetical protein H6G00_01945 [Leptolyngbya sp. FACHB-541]|uniref:hypothetical protein n=1 Tax=Leptolyngbya sp. FACHB-541 TaxID=2692810 RepID=UPI0016894372|nr:hypothetical protein [Leptolyngbya sp. FACHB-541]MBD1995394.1 hypothetical protein [Leptolyngbya sp. FACHB-541]
MAESNVDLPNRVSSLERIAETSLLAIRELGINQREFALNLRELAAQQRQTQEELRELAAQQRQTQEELRELAAQQHKMQEELTASVQDLLGMMDEQRTGMEVFRSDMTTMQSEIRGLQHENRQILDVLLNRQNPGEEAN